MRISDLYFCTPGVGFTKARMATAPSKDAFTKTSPNASPAVSRKLVACSSSANFTGGAKLESSMKNSNILGTKEQLATDRTRKKFCSMSGMGIVRYIMMFTIYIVSTSIQNRAGLKDKPEPPAPPPPPPPPPAAGPTAAAATPAPPAARVTAEAAAITYGEVTEIFESIVTLGS